MFVLFTCFWLYGVCSCTGHHKIAYVLTSLLLRLSFAGDVTNALHFCIQGDTRVLVTLALVRVAGVLSWTAEGGDVCGGGGGSLTSAVRSKSDSERLYWNWCTCTVDVCTACVIANKLQQTLWSDRVHIDFIVSYIIIYTCNSTEVEHDRQLGCLRAATCSCTVQKKSLMIPARW